MSETKPWWPECTVPTDMENLDDPQTFCDQPAITMREVEGIDWPLCAEHAKELDAEMAAAAPKAEE